MIKNEKLYINNHKEFAHFSCLLFAPIFMPLKNGNLRKELKIENLKRTKYEYISYQGEQLNLNLDFKIYSLIASRAQSLQSNSITFTEKQLIRIGLGRSISSIIKSQIEQSLKVLQKSQFRIDKFDEFGNKVSGKYTSLVKSYEWNFAKKIINIEVESELINLDVCNFSKEKIYMDIVNGSLNLTPFGVISAI